MPSDEQAFLARQDVTAQQVTGLMNTYKTVIEENGGKVGKTEYWGLKSTAYRIKKNRRAHYAFFNIEGRFSRRCSKWNARCGFRRTSLRFLDGAGRRAGREAVDPDAQAGRSRP